jgi:hypothetical protein
MSIGDVHIFLSTIWISSWDWPHRLDAGLPGPLIGVGLGPHDGRRTVRFGAGGGRGGTRPRNVDQVPTTPFYKYLCHLFSSNLHKQNT